MWGVFAFVNKNLPAVHLDGGQGLEGDAHHLVEADPGQVGRHALDARPEGLRVIQVLNFKISQLLAGKSWQVFIKTSKLSPQTQSTWRWTCSAQQRLPHPGRRRRS